MSLGILLKRHRKDRSLTLRAVASRAGISDGFLSQVENDVKTPSLPTLMNICDAMAIDVGELLSEVRNEERLYVVRKSEWDEVDLPHTGFATRRFCPPEKRSLIDSALLFIEPGVSIPVRKNLKSSQEILCVLQGSVELSQGDEKVVLDQGDSAHYWSLPERQAVVNQGSGRAVVLWVGTI